MNVVVCDKKGGKRILPYRGEDNLLRLFALHGIFISARCGGAGRCGKCKIKLLSGTLDGGETAEENVYFACKAKPLSDCELLVESENGSGLEVSSLTRRANARGTGLGIAVDLGTTTIAASLLDLSDGAVLGTASCLNPQAVFGSDVLSRIRACENAESLASLTSCVRKAINGLVSSLLPDGGELQRMTVAGNTTMLHLFCGVDPTPIGIAPFTPAFTEMREYRGEELGLPAAKIVTLPSVSAYVGADITADILAADLMRTGENVLLIDLGTNGEMALKFKDMLVCTSTAAGPALEGACIECGVGGVRGAVNRVRIDGGKLTYSTIEGAPPVGICGAGLVDLIAALLDLGEIDGTGYLSEERYVLCENVYLSRADVRQFQLAKGAVSAGIAALLHHAGLSEKDLSRCLIAGGLGSYMNVENAAKTGLIPQGLKDKTQAVGNGSLYGTQLALLDGAMREEATAIADCATAIDLSGDVYFAEEFIRRMCFE